MIPNCAVLVITSVVAIENSLWNESGRIVIHVSGNDMRHGSLPAMDAKAGSWDSERIRSEFLKEELEKRRGLPFCATRR
jgi:hypothetical protein